MSVPVPRERIEQTILVIRGHRVMLDADLAELYGVETKAFNRAVTRNMERFPVDFMFRLTKKEYEDLRYHFGTSRWGGRRYLPYAFTEQGVAMLSSVFRNERARAPIGHGTMPHWYRSTRSDIHCSERLAYGG